MIGFYTKCLQSHSQVGKTSRSLLFSPPNSPEEELLSMTVKGTCGDLLSSCCLGTLMAFLGLRSYKSVLEEVRRKDCARYEHGGRSSYGLN